MNYYQYKKRVPESRKGSDYIKPFLVLVVFLAIIFAAWKLLSSIFGGGGDEPVATNEGVQVQVETGAAKIMTSSSTEWKSIPASVEAIEGEKLQTLSDGRVSLAFFEGSQARLNDNSTLSLDTLSQDGSKADVELTLTEGDLWGDLSKTTALDSVFTVETDTFVAKPNAGSKFAVSAPDSLYVLEGSVEADVLDGKKVVDTISVGVGQQLVVDATVVSNLSKGLKTDTLFAVDENFKTSEWYQWNQKKDGVNVDEDNEDTVDPTDEDTKKSDEDDKDTKKDEEDSNGDGPSIPQITSPAKNDAEFTLTKVDQFISGTVSKDTEKVKVNEYTLNQYVAGSGEFTYKASAAIGNLVVGSNHFTVTAFDKAGNKSDVAEINLILPQKVFDDAGLKDEDKKDEEASATGGVSITSPNGGQNLTTTETSFVISGTVPSDTAKVKVNNYQLQAFGAGSTTYKYNANTTVGTLKAGQKNAYLVEAFDANDKKLGSASITIDVSADASSKPDASPSAGDFSASISMPSTAAVYETTLNQINLGGTVVGEPEAVYVNGNKVESFASGTGKWSLTVTLNAGNNDFTVYAEKEGQTSSSDKISVIYKN